MEQVAMRVPPSIAAPITTEDFRLTFGLFLQKFAAIFTLSLVILVLRLFGSVVDADGIAAAKRLYCVH